MTKEKQKCSIMIRYGKNPRPEDKGIKYTFNSWKERAAFKMGMDAVHGWGEYEFWESDSN